MTDDKNVRFPNSHILLLPVCTRQDSKFVELRRQQLQVYIRQFFAVLPESRTCVTRAQLQQVLPFFNNNN